MSIPNAAPFSFKGACHCGAFAVSLAFTKSAPEIQTRSCQCGFCTRQGAITVSDPAGHAVIEVEATRYASYQFATRSATSLICGRCGIYVGAVLEEGMSVWSIANVRGLAIPEFVGRSGEPMVYEHETAAQRIERRKQRWTPTEIRFKA